MQGRRVAVTGIGALARCGKGADAFWQGLLEAAPEGSRAITDFDPEPYFDNVKESRRTDRFAQFALAVAQMALEQAGDHRLVRARVQRRRDAHALLRKSGLQLRVRHAGLDDGHAVAPVHAQHLVQAAQVEHHGAGHARHGVAVEVRGAGAHSDERRSGLVGPQHQLLDFVNIARTGNRPRRERRDETLVFGIRRED